MDSHRSIVHAELLNASDDAQAIEQAHKVPRDAVTCEVWDVDRLVARFDGRNGGVIQPP